MVRGSKRCPRRKDSFIKNLQRQINSDRNITKTCCYGQGGASRSLTKILPKEGYGHRTCYAQNITVTRSCDGYYGKPHHGTCGSYMTAWCKIHFNDQTADGAKCRDYCKGTWWSNSNSKSSNCIAMGGESKILNYCGVTSNNRVNSDAAGKNDPACSCLRHIPKNDAEKVAAGTLVSAVSETNGPRSAVGLHGQANACWLQSCMDGTEYSASKFHKDMTQERCLGFYDCSIKVDGNISANLSGNAKIEFNNKCGAWKDDKTPCTEPTEESKDPNASYEIKNTSSKRKCVFKKCNSGYERKSGKCNLIPPRPPTPEPIIKPSPVNPVPADPTPVNPSPADPTPINPSPPQTTPTKPKNPEKPEETIPDDPKKKNQVLFKKVQV